MEEMAGVGFTTEKGTADELPPPGEELLATKLKEPVAATSAEVSATVSCVLLTYVTEWEAPATVRVVVGTNPVPVTVTVNGLAFTAADEGLSEVIAGAGFATVIVLPEGEGPLDTAPFDTVTTN